MLKYCRLGKFRENIIFANNIKRQSDFAISRGFYFTKFRICVVLRKIKSSQKFPNLQYPARGSGESVHLDRLV